MSKEQGSSKRRSSGERSGPASVRRPKRELSRAGSTKDRDTDTDRRHARSTAGSRGGLAQDDTVPASGLERVVAETPRYVDKGRLRGGLENARQLVRKRPLQAVLLGIGLGYLLSRLKVM